MMPLKLAFQAWYDSAVSEKWTSRASSYIERYGVAYPPFVEFVSFIRQISKTKNHPGFMYDLETTPILPLKMLPPFQVNRSAHPGVPTDVVALAWGFLRWRNGC
jgi:hypothetical protein